MDDTELHLGLNQLRKCIHTRDDDEVENVLMELESATLRRYRISARISVMSS